MANLHSIHIPGARRRAIIAGTILGCTLAIRADGCPGGDWPRLLGPEGTGISSETGLLDSWPAAGPRVLWKRRVGEGFAAPSVSGDRVVCFHRIGDDEVVECLAAATGAEIWKNTQATTYTDPYGYNGGPRCTPILTANRCYTLGAEGTLSCLDLASGAVIWRRHLGREFAVPAPFFGVGASPTLDGERLIVMVGGHPRSGVVALDARTGATLWEAVGPDDFPEPPFRIQRDRPPVKLASYSSPHVATINGRRHLLCLMRPGLVSLDPETGGVNFAFWFRSRLHDSVNAAQPVVIDDRILLTAAYDAGAVMLRVARDGRSADVVWRDEEALQCHWSSPVVADGFLFAFSGRHEAGADLRCVRASDGKVMWRWPEQGIAAIPADRAFGRGSAILADGRLIALGERGRLALLEANPDGVRTISTATFPDLDHPCWTAPVLAGGRLFITGAGPAPDRDGHVYHLLALEISASR